MPTLQRRTDGAYFIRNFYHDHHTWQVRGDGVRYLERRGVREGAFFDTSLMMQLYMSGWIFTGASSPGDPRRLTAAPINEALLSPIRAFHSALVSRRTEVALRFIAPTMAKAVDVTAGLASGLSVKRWKPLDALILPLNCAVEQPCFDDSVREAAVVTMRLTFEAGTEVVEEIWVRSSEWRIVWGSLARITKQLEALAA